MLQFHFNWKTLSVIAGLTVWNFYFQIFEESIKSEQVIEFLKHLLRYIPGDILLIWDRLPAQPLRGAVRSLRGPVQNRWKAIERERLPVCSLSGPNEPDLGADERISGANARKPRGVARLRGAVLRPPGRGRLLPFEVPTSRKEDRRQASGCGNWASGSFLSAHRTLSRTRFHVF